MSLELRGVSRQVGKEQHLLDVNLLLETGSLNVLLGPTLSGKTSLLRLMAGLDRPTSGQVFFRDRDITRVPVGKRSVAMVYQQFINYPTLSVYENIASPLRVARVPRLEIDRRVREVADLLRLGPLLKRKPLELSGGQQQRTALARAMVKGADLLLLDEPLANLDYKLREELRTELPRLFGQTGAILVYATTEPQEALLLGGHTATLHEGRVLQFGPTMDVYRHPNSVRSGETFSDPPLNSLFVDKAGDAFVLEQGLRIAVRPDLRVLPDGRYQLGFRAHHLKLNAIDAASVTFPTRVAVAEISGSETYIHVQFGSRRWVSLCTGVHDLAPHQELPLHLETRHLMVFTEDGRLAAPAPVNPDAGG